MPHQDKSPLWTHVGNKISRVSCTCQWSWVNFCISQCACNRNCVLFCWCDFTYDDQCFEIVSVHDGNRSVLNCSDSQIDVWDTSECNFFKKLRTVNSINWIRVKNCIWWEYEICIEYRVLVDFFLSISHFYSEKSTVFIGNYGSIRTRHDVLHCGKNILTGSKCQKSRSIFDDNTISKIRNGNNFPRLSSSEWERNYIEGSTCASFDFNKLVSDQSVCSCHLVSIDSIKSIVETRRWDNIIASDSRKTGDNDWSWWSCCCVKEGQQ